MNYDLYEHLLDAYFGGLNQDCTLLTAFEPLRVDDQDSDDVPEYCCRITVTTFPGDDGRFQLDLDNTPMSYNLRQLITSHRGEVHEGRLKTTATIMLTVDKTTFIRNLAKQYRRTVGRGAHYENRNWKWICRRTAKSLDRLAKELTVFRPEYREDFAPEKT